MLEKRHTTEQPKGSGDMELAKLREAVDAIDDEIVAALKRRFAVTDAIGRVKREQGAESVRNEAREQDVLKRVGPAFEEIYRAIMASAVRRETEIVSASSAK